MKTHKPIVVGLGEVLWDMLPAGKRAGGAPANVAYHAAHSGAEGWLVSAVGEDAPGQEMRDLLAQNGVQSITPFVPYPTGSVDVTLCRGIPSYKVATNTAWDHIPLTAEAMELLAQADAACFGTLAFRGEESRRTLLALLKQMPAQALKVFDINLRKPYYSQELVQELLQACNALKLNNEEAVLLAQWFGLEGTPQEQCQQLLRRFNLTFLIFTAGAAYSEVYTPGQVSHLKTPSIEVADTVGAGDSFTAAFVSAWLLGLGLREAHERAVNTAARVCAHPGAWG